VATFDPKFRPGLVVVILFFSKDGNKTQRLQTERAYGYAKTNLLLAAWEEQVLAARQYYWIHRRENASHQPHRRPEVASPCLHPLQG
jgi:hypothetical protein